MIYPYQKPMTVFKFSEQQSTDNWYILDDGVMGGRSVGSFGVNDSGYGVFSGDVSLENNGGFSSVRYRTGNNSVKGYQKVVIRVKGDKKRYQLRLKNHADDAHSYIQHFQTTGDWETISMDLKEFYPTFRGRKLQMPNYSAEILSELSFLISNKKAESFHIELDWMELR